jgi:hypothetical protein
LAEADPVCCYIILAACFQFSGVFVDLSLGFIKLLFTKKKKKMGSRDKKRKRKKLFTQPLLLEIGGSFVV